MGIQPSEFWDMTLPEFLTEVFSQEGAARQSTLTDDDRERYRKWLDGE